MEKDILFNDKNIGFFIDNVRILVNKKFLKVNLVVKCLFEQIEIFLEDVSIEQEKVKNGENKFIDICYYVEEWIVNY